MNDLKLFLCSTFIGLVLYLAGALIENSMTLNEWSEATRILIGCCMVFGTLVVINKLKR